MGRHDHDGRVFRALRVAGGEKVRAGVTTDRGTYLHAEAVEVVEASPDRVPSLCPIAGVGGSGCCDLTFVEPGAARALKGDVVANQLSRLGGYDWRGAAEPLGSGSPTGWRTRLRLAVGPDGRAGFHRYHSTQLGVVGETMPARHPGRPGSAGDSANPGSAGSPS